MAGETKELRVDMPANVLSALDALALLEDLDRSKYVVAQLTKLVRHEIHKSNLLQSMLRGNPLLSE